MRKTLVVHNRHALRTYRTRAALNAEWGLQMFTIEQLAARLAGGFLRPIDPDDFNSAVRAALAVPMGELDAIKTLPGFQRAAAASLSKAWTAGVNLAEESESVADPTAKVRLSSLAILEREVLARLPKNQLRPRDLVTAAAKQAGHAAAIFGRIEIHGRTEMSPIWRPLLSVMVQSIQVVWMAEARRVPDWISLTGVAVERTPQQHPTVSTFSCASPRHEILEALRWARRHLVHGVSPQEIAITAASPEAWDDHMLALANAANLPIHFVHGRGALTTAEGQLAAALAEVLLRGLLRALDRCQSASSLVKLLRDPLGYLWTYGFGWSEPEETDEPLTLDALAFGNLLHEILEAVVSQLEIAGPGGFARASSAEVTRAIESASDRVSARWEETQPVPSPVVWQRKRAEAVQLAGAALSYRDDPLSNQLSWAEIPFGGDRRADFLSEEVRTALPWDPRVPVNIPNTGIRIGGSIDRLDLAGDGTRARVTDYKSGRLRGRPPQLKGGAELQRCLYAYAVTVLLAGRPHVEAQLLYARKDGRGLQLENPDATLEKLTRYLAIAAASFASGKALPGPAAYETWYDSAFALPGGAKEIYLATMMPLVAQELAALAPLWGEP